MSKTTIPEPRPAGRGRIKAREFSSTVEFEYRLKAGIVEDFCCGLLRGLPDEDTDVRIAMDGFTALMRAVDHKGGTDIDIEQESLGHLPDGSYKATAVLTAVPKPSVETVLTPRELDREMLLRMRRHLDYVGCAGEVPWPEKVELDVERWRTSKKRASLVEAGKLRRFLY